jgi:Cobalamin-independent synthase, Catalytic domain
MPGGNPLEAAQLIFDEVPDLPFLAELPGRGPGADMVGRTAALLVDIAVEVTPGGWRIADHPGRDMRRARSMLSSDLDAMEEVLDGYQGPLKIQLAGPWTLAATIEQPHSLKVALADPGLVSDIASSLAEGVKAHVAEVAKRVPGATLLVQLDEPSLPAVAHGGIPSPSGLTRVREVDEEVLRAKLREVLDATRAYTVVHCCASGYPFEIINGAGADAVSFDLSLLRHRDYDKLAETVEGGSGLLIGALSLNGLERDSARPRRARRASAVRLASVTMIPNGPGRLPRARLMPSGKCGSGSGFPLPAALNRWSSPPLAGWRGSRRTRRATRCAGAGRPGGSSQS